MELERMPSGSSRRSTPDFGMSGMDAPIDKLDGDASDPTRCHRHSPHGVNGAG
jgi:hypothetical protein